MKTVKRKSDGKQAEGSTVRNPIEIQDIEEARRQEGIDDVELRQAIRGLDVGDCVKLTFVIGPTNFETVIVRITSMRGQTFRGKLTGKPISKGLSKLSGGASIVFSAAHIHSIPKVKQHASDFHE